jgi:tyrosinase
MGIGPVHTNLQRIRKDVWRLPAGDKTLEWYGKAVTEMKKKPLNDPTSWRYQGAIHGYFRADDPLKKSGESLPSAANQAKFWSQCQHNSWYFLPWHRGYLLHFERICRGHIIALGGPATWALPYWDYSSNSDPKFRDLPIPFRAKTVGSKPNPLFVASRADNAAGNITLTAAEVSLGCLTRTKFIGLADGGSPGFGGPITGFNHDGGNAGAVEVTPHGDVHVAVGGWMSSFEQAALDPIFWLHHCNIDRLWEVWLRQSTSQGNPTQATWLNKKFDLHDAAGTAITFTPAQMVDIAALGYTYQGLLQPLVSVVTGEAIGAGAEEAVMPAPPAGPRPPAELAGATAKPSPLGNAATAASVAIAAPAESLAEGAGLAGEPAPARRVFLNIENITGRGPPGTYSVYVNLPEGAKPEDHQESFAGTLPLFGMAEASRADSPHGGSGLTHVLEITGIVERLRAEGGWQEDNLKVAFVPLRPVAKGADIKIGRLSIYYG